MDLATAIEEIGARAKKASRVLALASTSQKNAALASMAEALAKSSDTILEANALDVQDAESHGISAAMLDRLRLNEERLEGMVAGIRQIMALQDPVGICLCEWTQPNGLHIQKLSVPIGVIGMIYESRPNVTSDAATLCLKAGNASILRGGSEAMRSNQAIVNALQQGLATTGLPIDVIQLIPFADRDAVRLLARMNQYVDLLIPRGGKSLIEVVVDAARVPVIKHYQGICSMFIDEAADVDAAIKLVVNAKCQRPGTCNALETLLVHRSIAPVLLPELVDALTEKKTEVRLDPIAKSFLPQDVGTLASPKDWDTEFLDLILAIKVVDGVEAAIAHIEEHGSHHSDTVVTSNSEVAERFLNAVDSAVVYWNASTRFTDGGEFGFGAEIGISTDKLHARGPMGLEELTTYKYVVRGTGQVR